MIVKSFNNMFHKNMERNRQTCVKSDELFQKRHKNLNESRYENNFQASDRTIKEFLFSLRRE